MNNKIESKNAKLFIVDSDKPEIDRDGNLLNGQELGTVESVEIEDYSKAENLKIIGNSIKQLGEEMRKNNDSKKALELHSTWMKILRIYDYLYCQTTTAI